MKIIKKIQQADKRKITAILCILLITILVDLGYTVLAGTKIPANLGAPKLLQNPLVFSITFFIITTLMGIVAVLAGIGGGVVYTPIMMGFTPINSFIIRGTGLLVAMAGAVVAGRPFLRRGVANIKLLLMTACPYTLFAVIGALYAGCIRGTHGEGIIRIALGTLVLIIVAIFIFFRKKVDYPEVTRWDSLSEAIENKLNLSTSYWEESIDKVVSYIPTRPWLGLILFCFIGFISGLFGLGGGWAMVPALNIGMGLPLKVAATCSKILIGMGDTAAVWAYINMGAILPLFAVPCTIGLITGTIIGARIMLKVETNIIRYILIAVLTASGIRLISKGLRLLHM